MNTLGLWSVDALSSIQVKLYTATSGFQTNQNFQQQQQDLIWETRFRQLENLEHQLFFRSVAAWRIWSIGCLSDQSKLWWPAAGQRYSYSALVFSGEIEINDRCYWLGFEFNLTKGVCTSALLIKLLEFRWYASMYYPPVFLFIVVYFWSNIRTEGSCFGRDASFARGVSFLKGIFSPSCFLFLSWCWWGWVKDQPVCALELFC